MNILITGGAGFLGTNLAKKFLREGHRVIVVDNLITGSFSNVSPWISDSHFVFYKMSIESDAFLSHFLKINHLVLDQIYHLACPTGVPNIEYLGEEMLEANARGTRNVLCVALAHHAKLFFSSSSEVYGAPQEFPQREGYTGNVDPQGWRANYEEGKRFSEAQVALFVRKYGVNARTVRFFNAYGPHMSLQDQRVIPQFIQQALKNEPLTVHNNGAYRTFCYIDDMLDGIEIIMEKSEPGSIYNLGSDKEIKIADLAQTIIELTNSESDIEYVQAPYHDHERRLPDLQKVRSLGWNYRMTLEGGLQNTIAYFKKRLALVPVM